jgi:CheY-like chemotaxis protein/two-component sensor histidine kinase
VLNPTAFNFKELISKVTDIIHFRIVEKQQMFAVHIDENIPNLLICDEQWLAQVIVNLLSNAVKFTPDKGAVSLVAALADEEPDFCVVRFEVMDTGVGINKEQQERLFHSFEQAESSTTRKYGGTGLGLAISKRVVEMMDGKIEVTSAPGKGSAFTFTIKAEIPHEVIKIQKQKKESNKSDNFEGSHVLLAEDVEINREIVKAMLEPTLVEIDCAENGAEAVRMFNAAPDKYDIIFMDLQMPEMDGFEATRRIRASDSERATTIPIVAMTANVFQEDIENCLEAGMNSHLGKPINMGDVLGALRTYLLK